MLNANKLRLHLCSARMTVKNICEFNPVSGHTFRVHRLTALKSHLYFGS